MPWLKNLTIIRFVLFLGQLAIRISQVQSRWAKDEFFWPKKKFTGKGALFLVFVTNGRFHFLLRNRKKGATLVHAIYNQRRIKSEK